jgi:NCS1 family nucleobase:cation symporter-1
MTLGALIAAIPAAAGGSFLDQQVGFLGELAGGGAAAVAIYLVIVVGKLTVNCLNAYGGFMCLLTTVTAMTRAVRVSRVGRVAFIAGFLLASVLIALLASANFLDNFRQFILALLMVFTPWSAINLIDYYLVSRERVDVPALYDPDGRYGRWNVVALVSYAVGVVVQIPFMAQALYTGPVTEALGGADISWLVGLAVTAAVYYPWARRTTNAPVEMVYPTGTVVSESSAERSEDVR